MDSARTLFGSSSIAAVGGTAAIDKPPSGLAVNSAVSSIKRESSDVMQGRVSLAALMAMVLIGMGFYYWTRSVQGGG